MKAIYISLCLAGIVLGYSCKKNEIKPISLPMYRQDYWMDAYTNDIEAKSFVSLNGVSVIQYDPGVGPDQYHSDVVPFEKIDLGYASGGILTTPGSPEADKNFNSATGGDQQDVKNWTIRNSGFFAVTKLSKASFDTLIHIEAVQTLAQGADQTAVQLNAGDVVVFNLTRAYGLLYVKSANAGSTNFSTKYLLIKK